MITLGHMYRYKTKISQAEWGNAFEKMYYMASDSRWKSDPTVLNVERSEVSFSEVDLIEHISRYFKEGPQEVHAITLADSVCELWGACALRPK